MEEEEIVIEIKHPEIFILLAFLFVVLFLELQVTLNSHIVFGDEGTHARYSQWIAEELEYPLWTPFGDTPLYKRGFSRPPLWNLLGASLIFIFGHHEAILKFLPPFVGLIIGLAIFALTKKIYGTRVALFASIIAVSIPALSTYAVLYYTDVLFTLYFAMSILTLILAIEENKRKYWILSGVFCGLAFLTKSPAFALFPVYAFCFLYQLYRRENLVKVFKNYVILGLFMVLLIAPFFARGYFHYGYPSCNFPIIPFISQKGCSFDIRPESQFEFEGWAEMVGTEQGMWRMGVMNYLNFAYGNVWFVVFGSLCGFALLIWRGKLNDKIILISIICMFLIVYRNSEGRAENLSRYLLGWAPLIAIVAGNYFNSIYNFIKRYQKYLAIIVIIFVLFYSYQNLKEKLDVMTNVKRFSPSFFEACDWVKGNLDKDVRLGQVVWAGAAIYNCQRNVGGGGPDVSLSNNLTLVLSSLESQEVTHIFIQKFSISYTDQKLSEKYPISFIRFLEDHSEQFEKLFENGPSIDQCIQAGGCDGTIIYKIKKLKQSENISEYGE